MSGHLIILEASGRQFYKELIFVALRRPTRFNLKSRFWALICVFFAVVLGVNLSARADVTVITEAEFRSYAEELSHKVNLFSDIWQKDPEAEIYGGTTRDYLYWIKSQIKETLTREQALSVMVKFRRRQFIDAREFLFSDSDVDFLTEKTIYFDAGEYGISKIDSRNKELTKPESEIGQNEILQGFIPVEKIRLGSKGLIQTPGLGFGVSEIYSGHLTVHFATPEEFAKSKYAKDGLNHPILLAIRFLRLQALSYFRQYGSGYPDKEILFSNFDPDTENKIMKLVQEIKKPGALKLQMENASFVKWLNSSIQKSFRAYTNPTAAMLLMRHFGLEDLPNFYPKIAPMNQWLFAKAWDTHKIQLQMKKYNLDSRRLFKGVSDEFRDGFLYHGTPSEEFFRGILIQGVLPSEGGLAGKGLYGVSTKNMEVAKSFAQGHKEWLVRFKVNSTARIVDITTGEGLKAWTAFVQQNKEDYDAFCETFGVDILRYAYGNSYAYSIKNSAVLAQARGVHRQVLPIGELQELVTSISDPIELYGLIELNGLTNKEADAIWQASKTSQSDLRLRLQDVQQLKRLLDLNSERILGRLYTLLNSDSLSREGLLAFFAGSLRVSSVEGARLLGKISTQLNFDTGPDRKALLFKYLLASNGQYKARAFFRGAKNIPEEFLSQLFEAAVKNPSEGSS